jgi:hypothetical protein
MVFIAWGPISLKLFLRMAHKLQETLIWVFQRRIQCADIVKQTISVSCLRLKSFWKQWIDCCCVGSYFSEIVPAHGSKASRNFDLCVPAWVIFCRNFLDREYPRPGMAQKHLKTLIWFLLRGVLFPRNGSCALLKRF